MSENSRGADRPKRKAPRSAGPRPEIAAALDDARRTADLPGALDRAGLELRELLRAAEEVPEIAAALLEVHQVLRLRAALAVEAAAAGGDLRAIRALTDGTMTRLDPKQSAEPGAPPPHVAAAMIAAGITAATSWTEEPPAHSAHRCPACNAWLDVAVSGVLGPFGLEITTAATVPTTPTAPPPPATAQPTRFTR